MKIPPVEEIFFKINRPEYPGNPEALQSALAWSLTKPAAQPNEKKKGYIYEKISSKDYKKVEIAETRCKEDKYSEHLNKIRKIIDLPTDINDAEIFSSLLDGLRGINPDKADGRAASPIVPGAAFLQDPVGSHVKENPPNFALIFFQMYSLGGGDDQSPAAMWYKALRMKNDTDLRKILDMVTEDMCPLDTLPVGNMASPVLPVPPAWLKDAETPFKWFAETWSSFCHEEWRRSLPLHRWSNWASCILRTTIGLGFLWEATFYKNLGKALLGDNDAKQNLLPSKPLLSWTENQKPLSVRDQNSGLIQTVTDGLLVKDKIDEILEIHGGSVDQETIDSWKGEKGLEKWLSWAENELTNYLDRLEDCFNQESKPKHLNTIYTIQYSLQCRREYGEDLDYYGLLHRKSKRFLVVEPGSEWIVVLASLTAISPSEVTTLGALRKELKKLGLNPSREILITELESAGLMQSSHDADEAITVSGFLGGIVR